jgi:hypothetical protein
MDMRSFWERVFQPLGATMLLTLFPLPWVNDRERTRTGFANGQFMLFRREVYDAIGGHEAVKDKFVEDVNLGRLVKQNRLGLRVAAAPAVLSVRMYATLPQIAKGWTRIFYAAVDASRAKIAAFAAVFFVVTVSPYLVLPVAAAVAMAGAAGTFTWAVLCCALAQEAIQTAVFGRAYLAGHTPLRLLAWRWLAVGLMLYMMARTYRLCTTHKVVWRGTRYAGTLPQFVGAAARRAA